VVVRTSTGTARESDYVLFVLGGREGNYGGATEISRLC
jgi:hypothetical protein